MSPVSKRIALLGQYGGGNLGDAAIWESLLAGIRSRQPDAETWGFSCNPEDTTARHGIPAFSLRWRSPPIDVATHGTQEGLLGQSDRRNPLMVVRRALTKVPGLRHGWWAARDVLLNERQNRLNECHIKTCDIVVVAGGGQVNTQFGGPFTHPVTLMRWGMMCRRAGTTYALLSVGTGTLAFPSRVFINRALALADYVSFRDERSRDLVGAAGRQASVVPDLAYAMPLRKVTPLPTTRLDQAVVGVSPMAYGDPRFYPQPDPERYAQHLDSLATLTVRLLRAGHKVVLFVTDLPDELARAELLSMVETVVTANERAQLTVPQVRDVGDLFEVYQGVDVVVSARLHGVLLAHVAGRPALAIAHERKVSTLMTEMGQSQYCQPIDGFDAERGWNQLVDLINRRHEVSEDIRIRTREYRRRVDEQYDLIFGNG